MTEWWIETKGEPEVKGMSIADIKREVGIRQVLEHYGATLPAHRSLGWVSILCPFHKDAHPSASFNEKLGKFHCHTCEVGGDVVDVVCYQEQFTMKEALQWLTKMTS